jgi:hypothetical protein
MQNKIRFCISELRSILLHQYCFDTEMIFAWKLFYTNDVVHRLTTSLGNDSFIVDQYIFFPYDENYVPCYKPFLVKFNGNMFLYADSCPKN